MHLTKKSVLYRRDVIPIDKYVADRKMIMQIISRLISRIWICSALVFSPHTQIDLPKKSLITNIYPAPPIRTSPVYILTYGLYSLNIHLSKSIMLRDGNKL